MFCSKCGKEIDDSAVVCTGCGCPTSNYGKQAQTNTSQQTATQVTRTAVGLYNTPQTTSYGSGYSESDKLIIPKLRQYISDVNSIFVLSVISLLLSLGIGIIFAGIAFYKIKKLPVINCEIDDPNLIADFQKAQKKLSTATLLSMITLLILVVVGGITFLGILFNTGF